MVRAVNLHPDLSRALATLREGGLVAIPTETVYGLAADAENELAVRRLFAVKGRPHSHPVIVHLPAFDALFEWAREIPPDAWTLARAFWPGPLTLVLRRTARARDVVTAGQETVASLLRAWSSRRRRRARKEALKKAHIRTSIAFANA